MKISTIGELKEAIKNISDDTTLIKYKSDMEQRGYQEGLYLGDISNYTKVIMSSMSNEQVRDAFPFICKRQDGTPDRFQRVYDFLLVLINPPLREESFVCRHAVFLSFFGLFPLGRLTEGVLQKLLRF